MQRVTVANIMPGMVTARNVYDAAGTVLIGTGVILVEQYVERLKKLNIGSIYVVNPLLENMELPEMVKEETRVKAIQNIQSAYQKYPKGQEMDGRPVEEIAELIVEEVVQNRQQMLQGSDTRTYEDYIYAHAVNVAVLSVMTGVNLGYNGQRLKELAWGALLHDIGEMLTPREIVDKPGKLSLAEWLEVKKHPAQGFELLRKVLRTIPMPVAHVAFQHHENFDGSGYPRKLQGQDIHEYARIAAVANIYDALTADRRFRSGFATHEVRELMLVMSGRFLDPAILKVFLDQVASYPLGSVVRLSSGDVGVVTRVNVGTADRPEIRILMNKQGELLDREREVDLTKELTLFVKAVLPEREVIQIGNRYAQKRK